MLIQTKDGGEQGGSKQAEVLRSRLAGITAKLEAKRAEVVAAWAAQEQAHRQLVEVQVLQQIACATLKSLDDEESGMQTQMQNEFGGGGRQGEAQGGPQGQDQRYGGGGGGGGGGSGGNGRWAQFDRSLSQLP